MERLLNPDMIYTGSILGRSVQVKLGEEDLWRGAFGRVREALRLGQAICERWVQACNSLTSQFWKRYSPNPWKGEKYTPQGLVDLAKRLEQVSLKTTHSPSVGESNMQQQILKKIH